MRLLFVLALVWAVFAPGPNASAAMVVLNALPAVLVGGALLVLGVVRRRRKT